MEKQELVLNVFTALRVKKHIHGNDTMYPGIICNTGSNYGSQKAIVSASSVKFQATTELSWNGLKTTG